MDTRQKHADYERDCGRHDNKRTWQQEKLDSKTLKHRTLHIGANQGEMRHRWLNICDMLGLMGSVVQRPWNF